MVYWVVTGLVCTQRLQNSPPRTSRHTVRARSAPSVRTLPAPPPEYPPTVHRMATLREISSVELRSVIMLSAPKSCELDSLPASLIQDYVDDLLPFLTLLCNRSLQEGALPDSQKDLSSFLLSSVIDLTSKTRPTFGQFLTFPSCLRL